MNKKDEKYFFSTYQQLIGNRNHDFLSLLSKNDLKEMVKPLLRKVAGFLLEAIKGSTFSDFSSLANHKLNTQFLKATSELAIDEQYKQYPEWATVLDDAVNKLLRRIFLNDGHNDEKYVFQSDVQEWLSYALADVIIEDKRFQSVESIEKLLAQTYMLHSFYRYFLLKIPDSWIINNANQWNSISYNESFFKNSINTFSKNYFDNHEENWQKTTNKESYTAIQKATQYVEYGHLSEKYGFRNFVLLKKNLNNWLQFWDNLYHPLLQDMALVPTDSTYDILNIAKLLSTTKTPLQSSKQQLAYIILKNYFSKSHKVSQNLAYYLDEENWPSVNAHDRDDNILQEGKKQVVIWQKEHKRNYKTLFKFLKPILGFSGIMDWLFSYKQRTTGSKNFMEIYNHELEVASNGFVDIFSNNSEAIIAEAGNNFNLQRLNFITANYSSAITPSLAENLLSNLSDFLRRDDFYWDMSFSLISFPSMKSIGLILSKCIDPTLRAWILLINFRVYFEGWNIKNDYKDVNREIFITCGAILLIEHSEVFDSEHGKTSFINKIFNQLITHSRFADHQESYYNIAFMLLWLVVNQILPTDKLYYETQLIARLDNILDLLQILNIENYSLENESKIMLGDRLNREMIFIKRKMEQKNQKSELTQLENVINNLLETSS